MASNEMAQSIDAAGAMLAEGKPYLDAVLKDLQVLTGSPGELSSETQEIMALLESVLPQLLSDLKDGMLGLEDEKRAELIGRVLGAVLFEAALAVGTGGAAAVAIAGKLGKLDKVLDSFNFPGSDQIVKRFHDAMTGFLKKKSVGKHVVSNPPRRTELPVYQEWCFAPETLVDTPNGRRRIDEIREGDDVLAFDFDREQWVRRIVQACHRSQYLGAMIEITTERGTVEATAYHPFWVIEGYDLANRPRPRELAENEDEGHSLPGRWVNSHDLLAGDLLASADGRQLRVLRISQRYEESFAVCNLTIDTNHSFAVGNDGILVHNTGGCGIWGTSASKGPFQRPKRTGIIREYHLFFLWDWAAQEMRIGEWR